MRSGPVDGAERVFRDDAVVVGRPAARPCSSRLTSLSPKPAAEVRRRRSWCTRTASLSSSRCRIRSSSGYRRPRDRPARSTAVAPPAGGTAACTERPFDLRERRQVPARRRRRRRRQRRSHTPRRCSSPRRRPRPAGGSGRHALASSASEGKRWIKPPRHTTGFGRELRDAATVRTREYTSFSSSTSFDGTSRVFTATAVVSSPSSCGIRTLARDPFELRHHREPAFAKRPTNTSSSESTAKPGSALPCRPVAMLNSPSFVPHR